jgi:Flp pilus assembly protein TadG
MRDRARRLGDERGVTLVLVAGSLVALLSAAAIAIDIGNLLLARTEAQAAADAAALAGAGYLAVYSDDEPGARQEAITFAADNSVRREVAIVLPGDVDVDLDRQEVTVRVRRARDRGSAVATYFARIFGADSMNVGVSATARVLPVGPDEQVLEDCYLPIALPDRWWEDEGARDRAGYDDSWDPVVGDKKVKDTVADTYDSPFTDDDGSNPSGYTDADFGQKVYIRSATGGGGDLNPSWYFPWTPFGPEARLVDDGPGGAEYRSRFTSCMNGQYGIGDVVFTEPGAMVGPTNQGFDELIAKDANATWNSSGGTGGCVWRNGACTASSPRIKPVPLFNPTLPPDAGRKEFVISNIGYLFVEGQESVPGLGNVYVGRWLGGTVQVGGGGGPGGPTEEPLPKRIQLLR